MTENPPPPSGTPEGGGSTPPPPRNPYGSPDDRPSTPPPAPQNPYTSPPPPSSPPADPGPSPYGSAPQEPAPTGQTPYGAEAYPVTPGPAPVAGARPGDLLPRFLARLVDGVIFIVVNLVLALIFDSTLLTGLIGGILYLGYYAYMESSQGRTVGKQVLKLRVLGPTGGKPTMEEALRRNAWAALSIVSGVAVLGLIAGLAQLVAVIAIAVTISQDQLRRGWHDKFANTSVIKEG